MMSHQQLFLLLPFLISHTTCCHAFQPSLPVHILPNVLPLKLKSQHNHHTQTHSKAHSLAHSKTHSKTHSKNISSSSRRRQITMFMDPNLTTDILQSVANHGHAHGHANVHANVLSSVFSTMYTATLPPLDPDAASSTVATMKDYFIPTTSNEDTIKTLQNYAQAKQALGQTGATLPNSSDFITFDSAMPGAKGYNIINNMNNSNNSNNNPQYNYQSTINKQELEWIAQQFDIYMRKIPFAVTLYALIDFFILNNNISNQDADIISEELEDDRVAVVMDWINGALQKTGILAAIVVAIIFVENLTYHPL